MFIVNFRPAGLTAATTKSVSARRIRRDDSLGAGNTRPRLLSRRSGGEYPPLHYVSQLFFKKHQAVSP